MKDSFNELINENAILENTFYIEDTRFQLYSDTGMLSYTPPTDIYNYTGELPLHIHYFYELCICYAPTNIIYEDKTVSYDTGTLVIIPPRIPHTMQRLKKRQFSKDYGDSLNFSMNKFASTPGFSLYETLKELLTQPMAIIASDRVCEIIARFDRSHPNTVANDSICSSAMFHELISIILKQTSFNLKIDRSKKNKRLQREPRI